MIILKGTIGFRIYKSFQRPEPALIKRFLGLPSSNIGDMMNRLYCMREEIRSINGRSMVGPAFTVKAPIGDNLMFHKALDLAEPGDVLVVDGQGATERSLAGEIMFTYAQQRGIAGVVIDGCIRDVDKIQQLDIPVFAKGITPQGPYKHGPGEINVPIACGGQPVHPGDIIVGDPDGIVVIPQVEATLIVEMALEKYRAEKELLAQYHSGLLNTQEHSSSYDDLFKRLGGVYMD